MELLNLLGIRPKIHDRSTIKYYNERTGKTNSLELDLHCVDQKLAIEHCGLFHHSEAIVQYAHFAKEADGRKVDPLEDELKEFEGKHPLKLKLCQEKGMRLVTIFGDEWEDKPEIVKSIIKHKLGFSDRKLAARDGEIVEIPYVISKDFFEKNHLMGSTTHRTLGLFIKNELVSAMSYCVKKDELELMRFASVLNTNVRGAFGKFLAEIKKKNIKKIFSYVDLRYGDGSSYEKLGFVKINISYSFKWTDHKHTFNRKHCTANMDDRGLSQAQHAEELGLYKIYDCGQARYELIL